MRSIPQCYEILGVSPGSSKDLIKQAYRDLVKVWHPDRFAHDARLQASAQEKLKDINEAYDMLMASPAYASHLYGRPTQPTEPSVRTRDRRSRRERFVMSLISVISIILSFVLVGVAYMLYEKNFQPMPTQTSLKQII